MPGVGVGAAAGGLVLVGDGVTGFVADDVEAFDVGGDVVGVVDDGGGDGVGADIWPMVTRSMFFFNAEVRIVVAVGFFCLPSVSRRCRSCLGWF
ncbi:hypothetical protein JCM18918_526 [Cutibacterium acnes JCM 18918]|nr:hypothetical protein JCM18918_526 [Cutibacterium acnes JCM 18918]